MEAIELPSGCSVKCYAPGDRCQGCAHYRGEAPVCEFAPKGQELLDRLQTLGDKLPAPYNAETVLAAKAMLERFIALADDEAEKAPLFKSPPNLDGVQMSERELAAYHLGREHVTKRIREILEET